MNTDNDNNTPWYLNGSSRRSSRRSSDSPIGSFPNGNDSPIGAFPSGNGSPIGAIPSGNDSYQNGYSEAYGYHRKYETSNFGNADNADMRAIPPYQPFEQSGYTQNDPRSYNGYEENSFRYNDTPQSRPYDDDHYRVGSFKEDDNALRALDRRGDNSLPGGRALGALPRVPLLLFSGWTSLTMILTIVLMCCGEPWAIVFEVFQLIPLAAFFAAASEKRMLLTFFILAGLSTVYMAAVALLRIYDPKAQIFDPMLIAPNLMLMIFFTVGILMMTVPTIAFRRRLRRCSEAVQGVIVKVSKHRSRRSKGRYVMTYCPTFEYTFRGKTYTASEGIFSSGNEPVIGSSAALLIDPDEPTFITDIEEHRGYISGFRFMGIFFCLFSMLALAVQFVPGK